MAFGEICLRDTAGSPEQARWLHLAPSGSQSQRTIWFILPARGASHIIILFTTPLLVTFMLTQSHRFFYVLLPPSTQQFLRK